MKLAQQEPKDKAIVVDFDGTLAEDKKFPDIGEPMPGAIEAMKRLKQAGFDIVIFTCRMNRTHGDRAAEMQRQAIQEWLDRHGVPYDRIDDGRNGKPFAHFYIDNKNLEYRGGNDWERLTSRILGKGRSSALPE